MTLHDIFPFLFVAIIVIAAIGKQLRGLGRGYNALVEQQRTAEARAADAPRAAAPARGLSPAAATTAGRSDVAAVIKAAVAAYESAPAYTAAVSAAPPPYQAPPQQRPAAVRRAVPAARSVDVPVAAVAAVAPAGRWVLADAFRNPANARSAVIMAEILGPPRALR